MTDLPDGFFGALLLATVVVVVMLRLSYKNGDSKKLDNGSVPTAHPPEPQSRSFLVEFKKNNGIAVLVIIGGLLALYGLWLLFSSSDLSSPSLAATWQWAKTYWLWIIIGGTVLYFATKLIPKVGGQVAFVVAAGTIALFTALPFVVWVDSPPASKAELKLEMPAYGESRRVKPPVGKALTITSGTGYKLHYEYADGRVGTWGDPNSPREPGHIVGVFVRDTSGRANKVTYEFIRP